MNLVCKKGIQISEGAVVRKIQTLSKELSWQQLLQLPDISWLQLLLAAAGMVVVIWLILRVVSRINEDVDPAEADQEMLDALNDLRREGDLTEDEFRSIKRQITGRLKAQWKSLPKAVTPAGTATVSEATDLDEIATESDSVKIEEQKIVQPETAQSNQSETFVRPTNVPDASQDPEELAKRSTGEETEDRLRSTDAGSSDQG